MTKINTILLADDDPDDRFLFEEALAIADGTVQLHCAVDGVDTLEKLNSQTLPDVIFMDVNMPRMNGIDCLRAVRSSEALRAIPVIMYSTSSHYRTECFDSGATDYIEKPSDFDKLCAKLQQVLIEGAKPAVL